VERLIASIILNIGVDASGQEILDKSWHVKMGGEMEKREASIWVNIASRDIRDVISDHSCHCIIGTLESPEQWVLWTHG
jgi:hypothetical protein